MWVLWATGNFFLLRSRQRVGRTRSWLFLFWIRGENGVRPAVPHSFMLKHHWSWQVRAPTQLSSLGRQGHPEIFFSTSHVSHTQRSGNLVAEGNKWLNQWKTKLQWVEKGRPSTWFAFTPHQALYRDNLHIPFIVMNVQYLVTKH